MTILPLGLMDTGLMGLASAYVEAFAFDMSRPAWAASGTNLFATAAIPVPDMSTTALDNGAKVQPRPGTVPGLYLLQDGNTYYHYDRRRLDPDDLLVVEDAEVSPDALDVAAALVRVPAVDRAHRTEHCEHVREDRPEEPVGVMNVDLSVAVGPVLAAVVRPLASVVDEVRRVGRDECRLLACFSYAPV